MRTFFLLLLLGLGCSWASAQIEDCSVYRDTINDIVNGIAPKGDGAVNVDPTIKLVDIGDTARCFVYFAAGLYADTPQSNLEPTSFASFVQAFESSRTDQQAGASSGGAASTSVTAQGPVATALSVAVEYGALTQSTNGQIVTLRGNLAGLPSA